MTHMCDMTRFRVLKQFAALDEMPHNYGWMVDHVTDVNAHVCHIITRVIAHVSHNHSRVSTHVEVTLTFVILLICVT